MKPKPSPQNPPIWALVGAVKETITYSAGLELPPVTAMWMLAAVSPGAKVTVPLTGT